MLTRAEQAAIMRLVKLAATREMATDSDARLWVALDGSTIWED